MTSHHHLWFCLDPALSRNVAHRPGPPSVHSSYILPWRCPPRHCMRPRSNSSRHGSPAQLARLCFGGHYSSSMLPARAWIWNKLWCRCCSLLSVVAGSGDGPEVRGAWGGTPTVFLNCQLDPVRAGGSCGSRSLRRRWCSFWIYFGPACSSSGGPTCVCLQLRACLARVHVFVWCVHTDWKYNPVTLIICYCRWLLCRCCWFCCSLVPSIQ